MSFQSFTALALATVVSVPVAQGQNLVSNSGFDTDVTGWIPLATASIVWSPVDADLNPAYGSALVTNLSTTPGDGTGTVQCIEGLSGGRIYRLAADILVPGGQTETGNASLLVQWFDQPGCNSGQIGLVSSPAITTFTPDVWYTIVESVEAPAGTQAARIRLTVMKLEDSGSLDANFDNVGFEYYLFSDGFESSNTSAWSSVTGGI